LISAVQTVKFVNPLLLASPSIYSLCVAELLNEKIWLLGYFPAPNKGWKQGREREQEQGHHHHILVIIIINMSFQNMEREVVVVSSLFF
jgi:hypothetical protein